MLYKLVIISLFIITYTGTAMDNSKLPAAPEKSSIRIPAPLRRPVAKQDIDEYKRALTDRYLKGAIIDRATGNTPLHIAANNPQIPDLIEIFFQKKPELTEFINHRNHQGNTALEIAKGRNHQRAVNELLRQGARVDEKPVTVKIP